jgi:hypothetical protein
MNIIYATTNIQTPTLSLETVRRVVIGIPANPAVPLAKSLNDFVVNQRSPAWYNTLGVEAPPSNQIVYTDSLPNTMTTGDAFNAIMSLPWVSDYILNQQSSPNDNLYWGNELFEPVPGPNIIASPSLVMSGGAPLLRGAASVTTDGVYALMDPGEIICGISAGSTNLWDFCYGIWTGLLLRYFPSYYTTLNVPT